MKIFESKFKGRWLFFLAIIIVPLLNVANSGCKKNMELLQKSYSSFTRLKADFVHTLEAPALKQHVVEKGTLYLERGGKMRWEYTQPQGKLAVSDGKTTWLYLPAEHQVFVRPMKQGPDSPILIRMLSGKVELKKEFECESESLAGNKITFRLKLKKADAGLRNLTVVFDRSSALITRVSYKDAVGNVVVLELTNLKIPTRLDQDMFSFTVPPGVRVIG